MSRVLVVLLVIVFAFCSTLAQITLLEQEGQRLTVTFVQTVPQVEVGYWCKALSSSLVERGTVQKGSGGHSLSLTLSTQCTQFLSCTFLFPDLAQSHSSPVTHVRVFGSDCDHKTDQEAYQAFLEESGLVVRANTQEKQKQQQNSRSLNRQRRDYYEALNEDARQKQTKTTGSVEDLKELYQQAKVLHADSALYEPEVPSLYGREMEESWTPALDALVSGLAIARVVLDNRDSLLSSSALQQQVVLAVEKLSAAITKATEYIGRSQERLFKVSAKQSCAVQLFVDPTGCSQYNQKLAGLTQLDISYIVYPDCEDCEELATFTSLAKNSQLPIPFNYSCAIVFPKNDNQVVKTLMYLGENGIDFSIKGGGHSAVQLSVFSGGVVIDMQKRPLTFKQVAKSDVFEVSSNALNLDVYTKLYAAKGGPRMTPSGSCPPVGATGLVIGGGYGYSTRTYGLLTDNLVEVTIATPEYGLVKANEKKNPDLFWACRGGSCAHAGPITKLKVRTYPAPTVTYYRYLFAEPNLETVIATWQDAMLHADNRLANVSSSALMLGFSQLGCEEPPCLTAEFKGQYVGGEQDFQERVVELILPAELLEKAAVKEIHEYDFESAFLKFGGCVDGVLFCLETLKKHSWGKTITGFVDRNAPLTSSGIQVLLTSLRESKPHQTQSLWDRQVRLYSFGGKMHDPQEYLPSAFAHRNNSLILQFMLGFPASATTEPCMTLESMDDAMAWVYSTQRAMVPHSSPNAAYVNFADLQVDNFQSQYYGPFSQDLQEIKAKYDPYNWYRGNQVIRGDMSHVWEGNLFKK